MYVRIIQLSQLGLSRFAAPLSLSLIPSTVRIRFRFETAVERLIMANSDLIFRARIPLSFHKGSIRRYYTSIQVDIVDGRIATARPVG